MEKRLECIKEMLVACVEKEVEHLDVVDAKELGEVIDIIKDIDESIYYSTVTKAMKEYDDEGGGQYRTKDKNGKHYGDGCYAYPNGDGRLSHTDKSYMWHEGRDIREGRSPGLRRMYMEHKENNAEKAIQMRELENYVQELGQDIVEMIDGASAEEKQYLSKKISALATKIQ